MLNEIYAAYSTSAADYLESMREAVRDQDSDALARAAHALNGASANIGANGSAELAGQLENLGCSGTVHEAEKLLGRLEREIAAAQIEIQHLVSNLAPTS